MLFLYDLTQNILFPCIPLEKNININMSHNEWANNLLNIRVARKVV
jgi:hypothetical protein